LKIYHLATLGKNFLRNFSKCTFILRLPLSHWLWDRASMLWWFCNANLTTFCQKIGDSPKKFFRTFFSLNCRIPSQNLQYFSLFLVENIFQIIHWPVAPDWNANFRERPGEAYWERRKKNNEAAKRSRDARRAKEDEVSQGCQIFIGATYVPKRVKVRQMTTKFTK
jgi:hypothetical protein